ncbi:MAG: T9SS type A sorting domain-containing protein [Bacteroidota bacterium]
MKKIFTSLLLTWLLASGFAQQNSVATGGNATGSGGTVSFSIGQVDYKSNPGAGGFIVLEGLQHPIVEVAFPIKLLSFKAACTNGAVAINWETASEVNSAGFVIEKSREASNWSVVATLAAAGQSNSLKKYNVTDNTPFDSVTYYRLKSTDLDGKFTNSAIVAVMACGGGKPGISVFPNPTTEGIYLTLTSANTYMMYELLNSSGQKVAGNPLQGNSTFISMKNLPPATYYLRMVNGASTSPTFKIVKK